ncbi:spore germination lipoprotein GerD [Sutcliffiella rhizosphaerae]|uniref:Spore germination protein GerD n=1 Tax=Sutcliffiella rhizosphaerae TaxID=2880967 RepID=A0ABM8YQ93_9BACI|nr:spore germination lipoprotein GerD [Sutcliffiella rhizosphaerae]CAG9622177.1 Spore germination protein GerD [Sutcliffiella rhizosphaerae]
MKYYMLPLLLLFLGLTGCAQGEQGGQMDYDQTKKMVVDILKTDDGKKAIEEIMADDKMKANFVLDQEVVTKSIEQTLESDKGTEFWKKAFEDPKFAETFAKSMQKEHEKLLKDLMKDPEYQGMMVQILQDPEMEKQMITVMSSQEYKKHLQKIITETFESPLFKAKIQDLLLKAAGEMQSGGQGGAGSGGQNQGGADGGQQSSDGGGGGP